VLRAAPSLIAKARIPGLGSDDNNLTNSRICLMDSHLFGIPAFLRSCGKAQMLG
jgi:hypothetical protein